MLLFLSEYILRENGYSYLQLDDDEIKAVSVKAADVRIIWAAAVYAVQTDKMLPNKFGSGVWK